ncbi:MAG: hypothetical protein SVJ22_11300, partial [Halobacteriota archaeon]|nr:hypothetical protein [Halobacteriota archaeon]
MAAILAITFAISQIIISNLSERYSPYILETYKNDPKTKMVLFGFIIVILASVSLLIINTQISKYYSFLFLLVIFCGFVYSLIIFVDYFNFMFEIINPLEFASILKEVTIQHIEDQEEEEIQNYISSIGDTAIKSLQRNEERVSNEYIQILHHISEEFLKLKESDPEKYKITAHYWYYDKSKAKNNVIKYILDQYLRIYKKAVLLDEVEILEEISDRLFFTLHVCLLVKDNDDLIEQILRVEYEVCKHAIEKKDQSRFFLIRHLVDILQKTSRYPQDRIEEGYLDKFVSSHLFNVTQLIIDHDDFKLFKTEINVFSYLKAFIRSPDEIQNDIKSDLFLRREMHQSLRYNREISEEINKKRDYLQFLIKYCLSKNFKNKKEFKEELEKFGELVIGHLEKMKDETYFKSKILKVSDVITPKKFEDFKGQIDDSINRVKKKIEEIEGKQLNELYIISKVHKTFFVTGAYILFKGKEGKINPEQYIKELWTHAQPEDS